MLYIVQHTSLDITVDILVLFTPRTIAGTSLELQVTQSIRKGNNPTTCFHTSTSTEIVITGVSNNVIKHSVRSRFKQWYGY